MRGVHLGTSTNRDGCVWSTWAFYRGRAQEAHLHACGGLDRSTLAAAVCAVKPPYLPTVGVSKPGVILHAKNMAFVLTE